jgi:Raf kinase inhibitor-like YbhB/YbcL family protein
MEFNGPMDESELNGGLAVVSPVFRNNCPIPPQYTCKGQNVNPPLNIFNVPDKAQSLTLIMHDPDAPGGDYLHWLVWDIPPITDSIPVNGVPVGAVQGQNSGGDTGYTGPCPPAGSGTHHYIFDFYALDTTLDLPTNSKLEDVMKAQNGHVLEYCKLTGLFGAEG